MIYLPEAFIRIVHGAICDLDHRELCQAFEMRVQFPCNKGIGILMRYMARKHARNAWIVAHRADQPVQPKGIIGDRVMSQERDEFGPGQFHTQVAGTAMAEFSRQYFMHMKAVFSRQCLRPVGGS